MLTVRQVSVKSVQLREFLLKAAGFKGTCIGNWQRNQPGDGLQLLLCKEALRFDEGAGKEEPPHQLADDQV